MYSVVGTDGQVYGPVAVETLKEWIGQGRILSGTNLIDGFDGRVLRADAVMELHPLFATAPPIITPDPIMPGPAPMSPGYQPAPSPVMQGQSPYVPVASGYPNSPVLQAPVQQAASFQQGTPGAPTVQVNNYIAMNNQMAFVPGALPAPRSKTTAILLCIFLGGFGAHRFYLRHNGSATAMLLITLLSVGYLSGVSGIWAIVDLIQICTGNLKDVHGQELV